MERNRILKHDKPLDEKFDKKNHICVSCDVVDYTFDVNTKICLKRGYV